MLVTSKEDIKSSRLQSLLINIINECWVLLQVYE